MKRKKERYRVIAERDNVLEPGKPLYLTIRNQWRQSYFENSNPLVVELACGRGEYTIGLAARFPDKNFIGVDIKGDRLWKGSTWALEQGLRNVAFLRASILAIEFFFGRGEVSELWITFPDPRPKARDEKRRLTHGAFLDRYRNIVAPEGVVNLKTDNTAFFFYTLETLKQRDDIVDLEWTDDVYQSPLRAACFDIETRYEVMFRAQGETIKYLRFRFAAREVEPR